MRRKKNIDRDLTVRKSDRVSLCHGWIRKHQDYSLIGKEEKVRAGDKSD